MERKLATIPKEEEEIEERLQAEPEMVPPKFRGNRRWKQIAYRSGLATLALAAGLGAASLLHRESTIYGEVLSQAGNCNVAVQVVGVRFIDRVGDPDVLDQGDEILGRVGNFTAFVQTPSGEILRTVFVDSDGVANTPVFPRRCDTIGVNGQPAVSLQLRTDQSSRVLNFNVEHNNARRVFVGLEVLGGVAAIPTPDIREVTPVATTVGPRAIPTPDRDGGPTGELSSDWWKWLLAVAGIAGIAAIVVWALNQEAERRRAAPPPQPPAAPQPQPPVQPVVAQPPVAGHEHPAIQQEIGALRRDLTAHGHRIQNVEGALGRRPAPRGAEAQAVVQGSVVQPAPEQPQAGAGAQEQPQAQPQTRAETQVQPPAQAAPEARREAPPSPRAEARGRGRERLRRAKRVDTWIDPEVAEQLAIIEAAEGREQPRVHVDIEGHQEEPHRGA